MTKHPVISGANAIFAETHIGRPVADDAERKAEVIERACAALVDENYMETAANFQDEYYGEASVKNDGSAANYEMRRNQQKNVARHIRNRGSS